MPFGRKDIVVAIAVLAFAMSAAVAETQFDDADSATHERAEQDLRAQERRRILGVIPNFSTSNVQDAAGLGRGRERFRRVLAGHIFQKVPETL